MQIELEDLLTTAHNLTDAMGSDNPEYERGITELVADALQMNLGYDNTEDLQLVVRYAIRGAK